MLDRKFGRSSTKIFTALHNQWHYQIPKFQREYTWGKVDWSKLIEDIYENEAGHYMGSVICVHDKDEITPGSELIYEVIDGQQRLTTLSILLMAIYQKLKNDLPLVDKEIAEEDEYNDVLNSIRKKLIKKTKYNSQANSNSGFRNSGSFYYLRVQPSSQNHNLEDYKYILCEVGLLEEIEKPKNYNNRIIYKSFKYFCDQLPTEWQKLLELLERINRLAFILISETSHSKAFVLFETLNNRGVPLSGIDIIKNKLLSELEKKHNMSIDDSFDQWQKLIENLPSHEEQDRYLRQFYNAFKFKDEIKVQKIPKATSSTLIKIFESLIKNNPKGIFEELLKKSKIYNQFIEPEKAQDKNLGAHLTDLFRIGASASYTFLLYIFTLPDSELKDIQVLNKTVDLFCKYYLRRNVTDFPNTRDLDSINIDLIEQCNAEIKTSGRLSYEFIEKRLLTGKGKPESILKFKSIMMDNLFEFNDGMARYLLAKIDESSHTREYKPDLWARNEKGIFVWTVEHVFPQGKRIPKDWIQMIANGDDALATEIQDRCVHCIGNLTLSGYNSKLSNHEFSRKQKRAEANIFGSAIKIGYQNGMALNSLEFKIGKESFSLSNASDWTEEKIKARNEVIVKMALELFAFSKDELNEIQG